MTSLAEPVYRPTWQCEMGVLNLVLYVCTLKRLTLYKNIGLITKISEVPILGTNSSLGATVAW